MIRKSSLTWPTTPPRFKASKSPASPGASMGMMDLGSIFGKGGGKTKKVKMKVKDAYGPLPRG